MDDLLNEFLTETSESLAVIDVELVKFEQDPSDAAILQNIFRLVHTIKGTSGFLGLPRLEKVAHAGEDVLGKFRDGELEVTPEAVTLILRAIDVIKELLAGLEENGEEQEGDDSVIIDDLRIMAGGKLSRTADEANAPVFPKPAAAAPPPPPPVENTSGGPNLDERGFPVAAELMAEYEEVKASGVEGSDVAPDDSGADTAPVTSEQGFPIAAELLAEVADAEAAGVQAASAAELQKEMEAEQAKEKAAAKKANVPAPAKKKDATKPEEGKTAGSVAASSIRVNVELLENLMTMVSELVLTRNSLLQMVRGHDDSEFTAPLQRLSHITSELQEGVMKTRMQPIGNAWAKLPRIVRDLSVDAGKKIELNMFGAETELDRQVLELIKDPLTHMVRNSADHGLEGPEERLAAGKPELGTVNLSAYHEGGHIIIEIADNGRGLNMERIRDKVIMNGLSSEAEIEGMTDQQVQQYIFKPGFSTAEKVTNVSGRGVGMDVVRTNIEKIGGTIELLSVEGEGTTFTIKIPLTLAIVSALIVECGGERFAIPQISVLELVRASQHSENNIESINNAPVLRLRNRLLPLVSLKKLLKLQGKKSSVLPDTAQEAEELVEAAAPDAVLSEEDLKEAFIVVTQVGTYTFGMIVDRVFDTEEIVVKPTSPILRDITVYSGNTILGDGSVIMILDPNGIASATGGGGGGHDNAKEEDAVTLGGDDQKTSLLIFKAGGSELKAVPLGLVARLEDIDMTTVEISHGQRVVQYRGQLMPLVPFDNAHSFKDDGRQPILVFTDRDRSMGLAVDEIVDIVEDRLKVELSTDQNGLVGSAVINGHATDVVDVGYFLTQAFPDWFGGSDDGDGPRGRKALLVDDSPFFRNLLAPVLSVAGFRVTSVEDAGRALKMREDGVMFDVIISDIEMPDMDGFAFARDVRSDPRWQKVPMIALSSHASAEDFERGRQAGFTEYVTKSDRDALVTTLTQVVEEASAAFVAEADETEERPGA